MHPIETVVALVHLNVLGLSFTTHQNHLISWIFDWVRHRKCYFEQFPTETYLDSLDLILYWLRLKISSISIVVKLRSVLGWSLIEELHVTNSIDSPFELDKLTIGIIKRKFVCEEELICYDWSLHNPDISCSSLHPALGIILVPHTQLWNPSEEAEIHSRISPAVHSDLRMICSVFSNDFRFL